LWLQKIVELKDKSKTHIYIGLGTAFVVGGFAFFVSQRLKKKQGLTKIDASIFDSPDLDGSGSCIDSRLVAMLLQLSKQTGYPIFNWITSGVRTPAHNRKVGGVRNSSHVVPICKAVDIKAMNTTIRNHIVLTARNIGFKRIGVGKRFVHLDIDTSKSQNVAWGYPSGTRPDINPFT